MKITAVLLAAIALLGASPAAPVRQLDYAFAIYPTADSHRGYFDGTLHVDIFARGDDGGTRVKMTESWYHALRVRQPRTCVLYAEGAVRCNDGPPYPTDSELTLFPLLGSDFFSGGSMEQPSKWTRKFSLSFRSGTYPIAAAMDLSSKPKGDGRTIVGTIVGSYDQRNSTGNKVLLEATFIYDAVAHVPLVLHNSGMLSPGSIGDRTSVDLQLMNDSALNAGDNAALKQLGPVRFEAMPYADEGDF